MHDPFHITGPALVSFSGGRTSGYMLHRILEAHGGTLPADVVVAFANPTKERPETLDFIDQVQSRWNVPIRWVEADGEGGFHALTYRSARRDGEAFEHMIARRKFLPNPAARFCTSELKLVPLVALMRSLGHEYFLNVVGIRWDEPRRVARMRSKSEPWCDYSLPLVAAKVTKAEVLSFWASQPFNLALKPHESNCDLCFMKGADIRRDIIRRRPDLAAWWIRMESEVGARFSRDAPSYAALLAQTQNQPTLFNVDDSENGIDCLCHD